MKDRLSRIKDRYDEINNLLMDPDISSDIPRLTELSIELKGLEPAVLLFAEYNAILESITELREMSHDSDPEIVEMAKMELDELEPAKEKTEEENKRGKKKKKRIIYDDSDSQS